MLADTSQALVDDGVEVGAELVPVNPYVRGG